MILLRQKGNEELEISGTKLKVTNLGKVFWPEEGYTKADLLNYYIMISSYLLPYLADRPESLLRYPDGIQGQHFFQKDVAKNTPEWIKTFNIKKEESKKYTKYLLCQNLASLIYMVNLGCIDINPWSSRIQSLDKPDFLLIDLDPERIDFRYVKEAALHIKKVLDDEGLFGYPKTTGATGVHIYIPLGAKYPYDKVRNFALNIVQKANKLAPAFTSLERSPRNRQGKVYLDYLQNSFGQTLAAPYCVRARTHAPVSTPLYWTELEKNIVPEDFNIKNIEDRLSQYGDIFKPVLEENFINKIE